MDFLVAALRGFFGLAVLIGIAYLFSQDKKHIRWRIVGAGLTLQIVFALLVLKTGPGNALFSWIGKGFANLLDFTRAGSEFIFGPLGTPTGPAAEPVPDPAEPRSGTDLSPVDEAIYLMALRDWVWTALERLSPSQRAFLMGNALVTGVVARIGFVLAQSTTAPGFSSSCSFGSSSCKTGSGRKVTTTSVAE
mgnify:CR=1 FL=1